MGWLCCAEHTAYRIISAKSCRFRNGEVGQFYGGELLELEACTSLTTKMQILEKGS